uniref:retinaldehyde-binding protein 1 n=1 Tax=Ciona intestinalis TaxID=7719 RepID=UPI000044C583|nr:retinaldehyde-binding protein 1 [Ciona intestinalis]|eukprot:XP_002127827.1 retinaldehyde-binding protein 1 [Ciona intestinalis]
MAGTFRRISVSQEASFTPKDHGPICGNHPIPIHTVKKAERELNETPERRQAEVAKLREIIETRFQEATEENKSEATGVRTRFASTGDAELIKFLRARKFDSEKAYQLMKGYVKYSIKHPDVVSDVKAKDVRQWMEKGRPGVLPTRDSQGRVILFFRLDGWDPEDLPFTEVMQGFVYVLEKLLESEETQINGVCLVEDFSGYTLNHVSAVGINEYRQMIDMLQGSFPCRFKGIHCIRQPWFFAKAFGIIQPFLKAKLFERIHVLGEDLEPFYNEFRKDILPEELGGSGSAYDGKAVAEMVLGPKTEDEDEDTAL